LNGTSLRALSGDGYLLIGDAAGLAHLQSGEGILPAVESGLLAAKRIACSDLAYPAALTNPPQSLLMRIGRSLPASTIGVLGRSFLKRQWFVREVVLNEWFLHLTA
jgi:hypothetical protein